MAESPARFVCFSAIPCLSICLSFCLFIYVSIYLSIHLSLYLSICLSTYSVPAGSGVRPGAVRRDAPEGRRVRFLRTCLQREQRHLDGAADAPERYVGFPKAFYCTS